MPRGRPRKQAEPLERRLTIRLTDAEERALLQLAANHFTTAAELVRELIRAELAQTAGDGTGSPHPPSSQRISPSAPHQR